MQSGRYNARYAYWKECRAVREVCKFRRENASRSLVSLELLHHSSNFFFCHAELLFFSIIHVPPHGQMYDDYNSKGSTMSGMRFSIQPGKPSLFRSWGWPRLTSKRDPRTFNARQRHPLRQLVVYRNNVLLYPNISFTIDFIVFVGVNGEKGITRI